MAGKQCVNVTNRIKPIGRVRVESSEQVHCAIWCTVLYH